MLNSIYDKQIVILDERLIIHHVVKSSIEYTNYMDYAKNFRILSAQQWIQELAWQALGITNYNQTATIRLKKEFVEKQSMLLSKESKKFNSREYLEATKKMAAYNGRIYCILYYWNEIHTKKNAIFNIILLLLYFIIWFYILCKSLHTLQDMPVTLKVLSSLTKHLDEINPFTNP